MKIFLLLPFIIFSSWAQKPEAQPFTYQQFIDWNKVQLKKSDLIIAEHLVSMIKLIEKGYVNSEILNKLIKDVSVSKNYLPFKPWLKLVKEISLLKNLDELIVICSDYSTPKEKLPLEKKLENKLGNYCRERTLEAIGRDIDKNKIISEESLEFIKTNLKFYLTKKNKKNFAFFVQSQSSRPEILKKISNEVTTYSVRNEIVPTQEVLQDILINDQITKLIQAKGFNPLQHKNVFYGEYSKLIEVGYRVLHNSPEESKVKEHFLHLKNYLDLNQDHLPVGLCLVRLNDFAKAVYRSDFKDLARTMYTYVIKKNNSEILEDAQFYFLWSFLEEDEFKKTLKEAEKLNLLKDMSKITDARLLFWLGYAFENTDKKERAIQHYEYIVANHPLNYYAIMAAKRLITIKPESPGATFYTNSDLKTKGYISFDHKSLDDDYTSSLVRLRAWSKIDNAKMRDLEVKRLKLHSLPNFLVKHSTENQVAIKSDLHLLQAMTIQDSGNHLATFRYLYSILDKKEVIFNRQMLEILYPKPFLKELQVALKKDPIDHIVVLSLIRQESVFNPLARSHVGARGLMQLMPSTAKMLRRSVKVNQLSNPKTNIELGTKYFRNLYKKYDGNLVYVLSAYNAGETRVTRWKKEYWDSDETIIKNIEAIPFLETRNYVKLIFRNIFFYKILLGDEKELTDSGEHNKIFDVELGFKR
jgi:soluble lytic murein transglycosylase